MTTTIDLDSEENSERRECSCRDLREFREFLKEGIKLEKYLKGTYEESRLSEFEGDVPKEFIEEHRSFLSTLWRIEGKLSEYEKRILSKTIEYLKKGRFKIGYNENLFSWKEVLVFPFDFEGKIICSNCQNPLMNIFYHHRKKEISILYEE